MSASPRGPVGVHVERGNQQRRIKVVGADGEVKAEVPHYAVVQALVEREGIATSLTPDALVEEELRAITVCEQCREKPLGMRPGSLNRRRHIERPWLCAGCRAKSTQAKMTAEQRSEYGKRSWDSRSDEDKRTIGSRMSERAKAYAMTEQGKAKLSEAMRRRMASMTHEERSSFARSNHASRSQEQRLASTAKGRAAAALLMTPEQRSEIARKRNAAMTPEQRSNAARKANAARRAKQAAVNESTTGGADE